MTAQATRVRMGAWETFVEAAAAELLTPVPSALVVAAVVWEVGTRAEAVVVAAASDVDLSWVVAVGCLDVGQWWAFSAWFDER